MHILFLTDNFHPEVNAPASRTFEHAQEWVKLGEKVTVVTCAPNFPQGKVFAGYKNRLWQTEMLNGIRVIRVWSFIAANKGFVFRTIDYLSYMITATFASVFIPKVDVVIGTSPQFFTVVGSFLVSRLKNCPFIFELRDLWPRSIEEVGALKNKFALKTLTKLEIYLYKKADLIVSVTRSFKTDLISRGIDHKKIMITTNGVDVTRFRNTKKDIELVKFLKLKDYFICGYIGTIGLAHGLEIILETADILQKRGENDIRLVLLGNGAEKDRLIQLAEKNRLKNIIFLNSVSKDDVVRYWSLLDLSIIHLQKKQIFKTVIPSKMFESMAMGIPLIHAVEGESADIVKKFKCGVCIPSECSDIMADAIIDCKENSKKLELLKENCILGAAQFNRSDLAHNMLREIKNCWRRKK